LAADAEKALEIAAPAIRRRHDVGPAEFAALGKPEQVRQRLREYIDAGASKFVMRPSARKEFLRTQVEVLATEVIPALQTPFSDAERSERSSSAR
jgi:alkanesulfonate monooxygenase SsuD/methylene tetrahydromethanopterin reductase-like flavin-dependent oxidoreductase (luciferase family)